MRLKTIYSLIFSLFSIFLFAQTTAIPDTNFEQQLVTLGYDTNGLNGNILNVDAQAVTTLTLTGNTITNLTGLEAFVNVITLNLGNNQFATVPTSTLTNLEELVFNNNLTLASLNLSNNINLKKLDIRAPGSGSSGPIILIDLSNNVQLEYIHIYAFYSLQNVIFPVTNTVEYVYLLMFANHNFDFSGYDNLETLFLSTNFNNSFAINVVLPNNPNTLQSASFQGGNIINANFSSQLALVFLSMQNTNTQTVQLPSTSTLKTIRITSHKIDFISFASAPQLDDLTITGKTVNIPLVIDISLNPVLTRLNANSNYMTAIDVSQNVILDRLNVSNNQLPTLNVNQNIVLTDLNASSNLLPTINLTQNVILDRLNLSRNSIPSLNLNQNTVLTYVDISYNLFTTTGLDLSQNPQIATFVASYNQIESLNILPVTKLSRLYLDHNLFSGTSILDQYYTVRQNDGNIRFGVLDVQFNNLSGTIPNYNSLFFIGPIYTSRFEFYFNNNRFEFGHFENIHPNYLTSLMTFSPAPFNTPVMQNYSYAPQQKVNTIDTINATAGNPVTLTTTVSGAQNHYTWFKNGVAIPGAPDSPTYTINSVNPCDQAIYYSEIRSDLVPFENANPPGTAGKNLLLVRNDITLNVVPVVNVCPILSNPLNGATNVPINPTITWVDSPNACSYTISIGTTSGGTQILNNVNVGNVNSYVLASNLPANTLIYITIIPNYQSGPTVSCPVQSFTTGTTIITPIPVCTNLNSPLNNDTDVAINSNISWNAVPSATGYFISYGTNTSGNNIINMVDVGNTLIYNPMTDFNTNTQIYVSIIPYNTSGNAIGCSLESFTTISIPVPLCTTLTSPLNNATDVSISGNISWNPISNATGYFISYGTNVAGNNIINMVDVGNVLMYNPTNNFPDETLIYVSIIPYNSTGNAVGCSTASFETEVIIPVCTTLTSPLNNATDVSISSNISWNPISNATGYFISYGTNVAGNNIINMVDVGNVLTYNPTNNFPDETLIYVSIIPYNSAGNAVGCSTASFETEVVIPICTTLTSPLNNATDVSISSNISWNAISNATGYYVSIGTTSGGTDIANMVIVTNTTYYSPANFPDETTIFVTIIPFNSAGNAIGCSTANFETEVVIPVCTTLTSPLNNATDVSISSNISWNAISNATGYFISYGTNQAGNNIINMVDVGNVLTYNPANDLPDDVFIFVKITPYNSAGNANNCGTERFKTEIVEPKCTTLILPRNGDTNIAVETSLSWNFVSNATGYFISIGTSPNGNEIVNMIDVGNTTFYNPTNNLPDDATIYVTITPYNSVGTPIVSCSQESFKMQNRQIITPPFFTPNGDGYNDVWKIEDPKNEVKTIYIFDRYGKLLYNIPNPSGSWNGTFRNQTLQATDYWFVIERKLGEPVKGHFALIR